MSEIMSPAASPEPKIIKRTIYEHVKQNRPVEAAIIDGCIKRGEAVIVNDS